jgi:hypothetical protein
MIGSEEEYSFNAVNSNYISATILPEDNVDRRPLQTGPTKTSIATSTNQYDFHVNASGTGAMFILPRNALGNGLTDPTSFVSTLSDPTFNPITGVGGLSVTNPGPLFDSAAAIEQHIMSTMSVTIRSTTSALNEQGKVELVYWQ